MATASRLRLAVIGPVVVVVAAAVVGVIALRRPSTQSPPPVAIDARSAYQFATLDELVAVSDAVVRAEVVAVERGRLVGEPGETGIVSRRVTLRIDELLAGDAGQTVLVEEEGWLADGTPIVVNGVAPSETGDAGVWFLDALPDPDLPAYLVVNSQGRFLEQGASLRGGDQRDPLVRALQALAPDELIDRVRSSTAATG